MLDLNFLIYFVKEIYGIKWEKFINGELQVHYEQNNMFDLPA